jgi:hypothetical protein
MMLFTIAHAQTVDQGCGRFYLVTGDLGLGLGMGIDYDPRPALHGVGDEFKRTT